MAAWVGPPGTFCPALMSFTVPLRHYMHASRPQDCTVTTFHAAATSCDTYCPHMCNYKWRHGPRLDMTSQALPHPEKRDSNLNHLKSVHTMRMTCTLSDAIMTNFQCITDILHSIRRCLTMRFCLVKRLQTAVTHALLVL